MLWELGVGSWELGFGIWANEKLKALFDDQKVFFDVNIVNETRNASYKRLAKIGGSVGVDESEMLKLLWVGDKPAEDGSLNIGNGVTNELKVNSL